MQLCSTIKIVLQQGINILMNNGVTLIVVRLIVTLLLIPYQVIIINLY